MSLTLTSLVLAASAAAGSLSSGGADLTGLPPVRQPLVFAEGAREARLIDLIDALAKGTGLEIAADLPTQHLLESTIEPLENLQPVPAEEAYRFVETILVQNGITFSRVTPGQRPILTLRSEQSRNDALTPIVIDAARLADVADHPALIVRTLITFQHLDARQVQTQLRILASSPRSITIAVGERALIVQDTATSAGSLVDLLRTIDEAAPALPAGAQEAEQGR
jgi:hypothetical protein